jgi:hypothetical protein
MDDMTINQIRIFKLLVGLMLGIALSPIIAIFYVLINHDGSNIIGLDCAITAWLEVLAYIALRFTVKPYSVKIKT